MAERLTPEANARFIHNLRETSRFHMGEDGVHNALYAITARLEEAGIPYAVAGAMALNTHGYRRATVDVDLLMTKEALDAFKARYLGLGYVEKFAGSTAVRDTENNCTIDFLITGEYPGDGKPKPVSFPDPATSSVRGYLYDHEFSVLAVPRMLELKLASGLSAATRLKDLADVLEWIKHAKLARALADELDPYVRAKYLELWEAAQLPDPHNPEP